MLTALQPLPADPILGLIGAFQRDPNPLKVDLGAGVYKDDDGRTPVLAAVREAESRLLAGEVTKAYVSPPGDPRFLDGLTRELFGADHPALAAGRVGTVQAPGGCGALRLGAELVQRSRPGAATWVSDPTWANHVPLLGEAGLRLASYPYYDTAAHRLDFGGMTAALSALGSDDLVLLHGCCHNPSGADLSEDQWDEVADIAADRGFTCFVDLAYQGLGRGLEEDAYGVRLLAARLPELLVAYSCSKNFGLYRERAGMIAVVGEDPERAATAVTHLNSIARGIYSMPPAHGAALVGEILDDPELAASWRSELAGMRERVNGLRTLLARTFTERGAPEFGFVADEYGLFSFLGITAPQVRRLVEEFSIYLVGSSRINVAGVRPGNVDYLVDAVLKVIARD